MTDKKTKFRQVLIAMGIYMICLVGSLLTAGLIEFYCILLFIILICVSSHFICKKTKRIMMFPVVSVIMSFVIGGVSCIVLERYLNKVLRFKAVTDFEYMLSAFCGLGYTAAVFISCCGAFIICLLVFISTTITSVVTANVCKNKSVNQ